jgi:hypothetical protein
MLPFVIQDVTPRDLRVPGGEAAAHPLGVTGIAAVTVVVGDLSSAGAVYAALLGEGSAISNLPAGVAAGQRFTAGSSTIDVVQPSGQDTDLGSQQFERGDNLYEALLRAPESQADLLPISLTHGARLRLVTA